MSHVGKLEEFDITTCDVDTYFERLECYFVANKIRDDAQVATFLSVAGQKTYKLLKSLVSPAKPKEKSVAQLKQVLKSHVQPQEPLISRRARFYTRKQQAGESITDFVADLKELAAECEFDNFLNVVLRDMFCIGIRDTETQKKLRTEKAPSFAEAVQLALAREALERDLPGESGQHSVHKLQSQTAAHGSRPAAVTGTYRPPAHAASGRVHSNQRGGPQRGRGQQNRQHATGARRCYRCGGTHDPTTCRFKAYECRGCHKKGHLQAMCRSTQAARFLETEQEEWEREEREEDGHIEESQEHFGIFHTKSARVSPWTVPVAINKVVMDMEIDTGSAKSIIGRDTYTKLFPREKLQDKAPVLTTYSGKQLPMKGTLEVTVEYNGQHHQLQLLVADVTGQPPILGREWLTQIKLDWTKIFHVSNSKRQLKDVLAKHEAVFQSGLGTMKKFKAKLHLKQNSSPKFVKARPVPFAVRPKVEEELNKLEQDGVLEKVTYSEWGSPIVVVPKKGGKVRICGDYKVTINPCLDVDQYPLPKASDLFATLSGGKIFSKLDLTQAYHQMEVEEESQELLTITTHKGLYRYCRLPFGVSSAPAVFQRTMEQILQGIPGVVVFIDDIELTGETEEEHLHRLDQVLERLEEHGLRLQKSKCDFMKDSVEYLGHIIDKDGLHPLPGKVKAISEAPAPTNVNELRSFLGMVQYYSRFLPNLATELSPLHHLLKDRTPWMWTSECQEAFMNVKDLLSSARVLTHYDSRRPVRLECDASSAGVGAVLSHVMPDGSHRPVAFASRTLTAAERNYAQIEKEALALVFGVKKFHEYLYGRRFTLVTDHKPLLAILGPKNAVPTLAAARMQRWALILATYEYDLEFRSTKEHANADMLSRLPLQEEDRTATEEAVFHTTAIEDLPVTAEQIAEHTRKDPILSRVWSHTLNGWPSHMQDDALQPYFRKRHELSTEGGVVLWGLRVIIPQPLQKRILEELHEEHPGMFRMKALARSFVWWANMDAEIETKVKSCHACTKVSNTAPTAPLHPWSWPSRPWQRVHIDFAEHQGQHFFVLTDAHSKWPEIIPMRQTTTEKTMEVLRGLFASYGFPEEIVSDNGPQFTSDMFATFLSKNGIKHSRSAPYHPATNGAAERLVQVLKKSLKLDSDLTKEHQLANLLLHYRTTPHTTTGVPPAELFLKRQLRTRLSLVKPDPEAAMRKKQQQQQQQHDQGTKTLRVFQPGDRVAVRQFRGPDKWALGTVVQRLGPVAYMVQLAHKTCHVHVDHLIPAPGGEDNTQVTEAHPNKFPDRPTYPNAEARNPAHSLDPTPVELSPVTTASPPLRPVPAGPAPESMRPEESRPTPMTPTTTSPARGSAPTSLGLPASPRRSTRICKKPARLDL